MIRERASMLRYTYIACIVIPDGNPRRPKHVVNKHRLSCVDWVFDYLFHKKRTQRVVYLKNFMSVNQLSYKLITRNSCL
jgi:hypothetical protein